MGPPSPYLNYSFISQNKTHVQGPSTTVLKMLFPFVLVFDSEYIQILNQKPNLLAKIPTLSKRGFGKVGEI